MKPIILLTIHRRYHELVSTLDNIKNLSSEFSEKPEIVIVWADPEPSRFWFFQEYLKSGIINVLIMRNKSEFDRQTGEYQQTNSVVTTPPEILNMKVAREYFQGRFDREKEYLIGGACDITVNPGIYRNIDKDIVNYDAILFYWQNSIAMTDCWNTNFFVTRNLDIWPSNCEGYEFDTLEAKWGKWLAAQNFTFLKSHNSRELKFVHEHKSEHLEEFARKQMGGVFNIQGTLVGYKSIWYYIGEFWKWLKS